MAPKDTAPAAEPKARLSVARNPKATYDYFVLDTMEAGVVLTGTGRAWVSAKTMRRPSSSRARSASCCPVCPSSS